ncbi:MAG: DUF2259 domain-containing protein [Pseudomonadota bacterium]
MNAILVRLVAWVTAILLSAAGPAGAADLAEYRILGYSPDGEHFAFEQFGIADGAGLPYSDIFIIDLKADRWVSGTPIRVSRSEQEVGGRSDFMQMLHTVRVEALVQARPLLNQYDITAAHRLIAASGPTEVGSQQERMAFYKEPVASPFGDLWVLSLERFPLPARVDCFGMVEPHGFRLSLQSESQAARTVYRDTGIPSSRGCPERYGIAAIIRPFDPSPGRAVALISVYQLGFEGLDRRFVAVPFDLPL